MSEWSLGQDGWRALTAELAREWDFIEHTNAALDLLDPDQVHDAVLPEVTDDDR